MKIHYTGTKSSLVITLISLVTFLSLSCNPNGGGQGSICSAATQPKLQFKANGTLYNFDAICTSGIGWTEYSYFKKGTGTLNSVPYYNYELSSGDHPRNGNSLILGLPQNQPLTVGTYTCTWSDTHLDGKFYTRGTQTVVVTSITNNRANGTFSGTLLENSPGTNSVTITEGVFSNLMIEQ